MSVKPPDNKQKITRLLIFLILILLAGTFRLINASQINPWQISSLLFWVEIITYGLISFNLARLLLFVEDKETNAYHIAVILTFLFSVGLVIGKSLENLNLWVIPFLILSALSSFAGSFILSNRINGWWENNAEPSQEFEEFVLKMHQDFMGDYKNTGIQKRLFDIIFASISLVLSTPIWILIVFLIWWEDPGPVLFVKNCVGRGGINYRLLKFRSMVINAEKETGPISGYENDERVLCIGTFLRKTALDELPQLINILLGDMSYVGPRPQRTVLVAGYLKDIPRYAARHRVRPGLAGLAQVADSYDISPGQKLAWDLVYIEKASLLFDLKLALAAFYLVFFLRWRHAKNPEGKMRSLLHLQKPDPL
jgi:lipopolysaccharide/colanic/teichoic acid biosynthesis glycosyltransferase